MATRQNRISTGDGRPLPTTVSPASEPQLTELLKQLGAEGAALVRSEMALAKLEMREMTQQLAMDGAKIGAAIALALSGTLALLAAAIIGLGNALEGRYALSALIVGVVMLVIGAVLAKAGMNGLKKNHGPERTVESLKETKDWAGDEAREFRDEVRS